MVNSIENEAILLRKEHGKWLGGRSGPRGEAVKCRIYSKIKHRSFGYRCGALGGVDSPECTLHGRLGEAWPSVDP